MAAVSLELAFSSLYMDINTDSGFFMIDEMASIVTHKEADHGEIMVIAFQKNLTYLSPICIRLSKRCHYPKDTAVDCLSKDRGFNPNCKLLIQGLG